MPQPEPAGLTKRLDALYEFDREPVAASKLCNARHFAGQFRNAPGSSSLVARDAATSFEQSSTGCKFSFRRQTPDARIHIRLNCRSIDVLRFVDRTKSLSIGFASETGLGQVGNRFRQIWQMRFLERNARNAMACRAPSRFDQFSTGREKGIIGIEKRISRLRPATPDRRRRERDSFCVARCTGPRGQRAHRSSDVD